jgi:competence protein ComGC
MKKSRLAVFFVVLLALLGCAVLVIPQWINKEAAVQEEGETNSEATVEFQQEAAELMVQFESNLETHHKRLQADGERAYQERYNEIVLEENEKLALGEQALKDEGQEYAKQLQDEYGIKILNRQLQLAIVSLSEEEQAEKIAEIEFFQSELERLKEEKEAELQDRLTALYQEYEESLDATLLSAQAEIEASLEQDYLNYKMELQTALDEEIALLEGKLRRSLANRGY